MATTIASRFVAVCALGVAVMPGLSAMAEEPAPPRRPSHNLFGMSGLIDTPSADMQPDGQFTTTASFFGGFLRNTISGQILPGVEAAFRYSVLTDFNDRSGDLFDRSFDIKARLIQENELWPGLVVGLQDFLGTGIYSGEYLVATKGFDLGDAGSLRFSGGIGWGRFAGASGIDNPLGEIRSSLRSRGGDVGEGGTVSVGNFFRGANMGLFGGVEWQTPIEGLRLKLEYSDDDYNREEVNTGFLRDSQFNAAIEYSPTDGIDIGAYYVYGSEVGVRVTLSTNPFLPAFEGDSVRPPQPLIKRPRSDTERAVLGTVQSEVDLFGPTVRFTDPRMRSVVLHERLGDVRWVEAIIEPEASDRCPNDLAKAIDAEYGVIDVVTFNRPNGAPICSVALRPAGQKALRITARANATYPTGWYTDEKTRRTLAGRLGRLLINEGMNLFGVEIATDRVQVYIENARFRAMPRAIGRTARILTRVMPSSVETFEITPVENSLPVATIVLKRSDLEDQAERPDADQLTWATTTVKDADPRSWFDMTYSDVNAPRYLWSIAPTLPISLFDPDSPVRADLAIRASATLEFVPGFSTTGQVSKRVIGNLDDISRTSDSRVENRVRSEFAQYLREGDPAMERLSVDYVTKLTETTYGRVSAGYLERMYAGVSGEVLWKPATRNWGVGLEANYVKQRDFDGLFGFLDYETFTGHASLYIDTNFYGISAQVDVGRYLAGDWGGTIFLKRKFDNGWEVGAFATFTTIPFDEFGEGSFDKGLFLRIPLNWALPYESRNALDLPLRPLTRDGGQRLFVGNRIYPLLENNDRDDYRRQWREFWE